MVLLSVLIVVAVVEEKEEEERDEGEDKAKLVSRNSCWVIAEQ